jgi:leucine dehydrogenase
VRLARGMTYKAALARLEHGGGKAVILQPPGDFDRGALLTSFGRFVDDLGGRYITTEDSGTSPDVMEVVRKQTRHVCGFDKAHGGSGDPSPFTALGVRRGIEACVKQKLGRDDLRGLHVAVQGVGHVGYNLCRELSAAGARLTVADVRDELAERAAREFGAALVSSATIHRTECDVYAPCALGATLNAETIPALRCRVVAGGANNQLATPEDGERLRERGILYAPDFVINAGGAMHGIGLEQLGWREDELERRVEGIGETLTRIFEWADREGITTDEAAELLAAERLSPSAAA